MTTFDITIFRWLNSLAGINTFLDFLIVFQAVYLWYIVMVVIAGFAFVPFFRQFRAYRQRNAALFISAFISAAVARFVIAEGIRFFYYHPRPFLSLDGVHMLKHQLFGQVSTSGSFPSGHASLVFAVATAVAFYYPKISMLFFAAAIFIGAGRVAAGAHWPSDILGGAIVGIATALMLWLAYSKFLRFKLRRG